MNKNGWRCFLKLCQSTRDEKTLNELFDLLLTHEERASIETRCLIVKALLEQKKPQREIAQELDVSIAKITRGSNEMKRISSKLTEFLNDKLVD